MTVDISDDVLCMSSKSIGILFVNRRRRSEATGIGGNSERRGRGGRGRVCERDEDATFCAA